MDGYIKQNAIGNTNTQASLTEVDLGFPPKNQKQFKTILADPPWRFTNRNSALSPENPKNFHYPTLTVKEIAALPTSEVIGKDAHLYLWATNSNIDDALSVMRAWDFTYKTIVVWRKIRKDGHTSHAGLGYYFRNATEILLFGTKGRLPLIKVKRHVNVISARRREHSRKPDETYKLIEATSPGPYMELFARTRRLNWTSWGNEVDKFKH